MIKVRRSIDRGLARLDWLHSQHSFSFAEYYDEKYMGFGSLRVINEDQIKPGTGFGMHGHQDMEILSYVLKGELEHKDDMGNGSIIKPGEIQRMTAGTGIRHSERNPSGTRPNHFFQIWIKPNKYGISPSYEQNKIPEISREGRLHLIGSPDGRGDSVTIHQDVELYCSTLSPGDTVVHHIATGRSVWIQLASGKIEVNKIQISDGDGAAVAREPLVEIKTIGESELLLFDLIQ